MRYDMILWLALSLFATMLLLNMMRRRQLHLIGLLKEHVDRQAQWDRRRTKAVALANAEQGKAERATAD